jgi:hypothetical protein
MLPDSDRLSLDQPHRQATWINLLDMGVGDPGQLHKSGARRMGIDRHHRSRAIEAQLLQDIDIGGFRIAADMHVLKGKAGAGGHGLCNGAGMSPERHAVKAGEGEKGQGRHRAEMRANDNAAGGQRRKRAHRTAQETRQNKSARKRIASGRSCCVGPIGPCPVSGHRRHEASSTIQLTNSSNEWPACWAISGASDVGVMPGWVLISSQMTSPFLGETVVVAEIGPAYAATADRLMRLQRQPTYFLVNNW